MTRWKPKYWCYCKGCGWRGQRTELHGNLACPKCEATGGGKYTDGRVEYQYMKPEQMHFIAPVKRKKSK